MLNIKLKDMTLNEKLSNMYQHPFDELVQHLKNRGRDRHLVRMWFYLSKRAIEVKKECKISGQYRRCG